MKYGRGETLSNLSFIPKRRDIWLINLDRTIPDPSTGLTKASAVDTLQLRGLDQQRFIRKLGEVSPATMEEITLAIATVIEYL